MDRWRGDMQPELLAPAGNWECAYAAVANGADAIYFGLDRFNARMRADNFSISDLPDLMDYLHSHGVKGYVTMNILIFTDEMQDALDYAAELNAAGVDGVIVQDLGFARLLSEWKAQDPAMKLELHASTQMTLSSPEALMFVGHFLHLERAVLARELSLKEIKTCAESSDVPLEVFVHGALCVAYSGQCLTSESLGQRSANRGECAQACRMPYSLIREGRKIPLGERRYLLSPKDLCAIDLIEDLVGIGVKSYKIEGRLKSPEYVAAVTRAYRKALDAAMGRLAKDDKIEESDRYAMQMVFSRGFSTGWMEGTDHPGLTHGRHGKKRGAYVGVIREVGRGWIDVRFENRLPIAPGDGFVFDAGTDRNDEQGGRIWKVEGSRLYFHGKAGNINWQDVEIGQKLWKTDDPALNSRIRKTWSDFPAAKTGIPLIIHCYGGLGEPLILECPEYGVKVETSVRLEQADKRPLTHEMLEAQIGRLGETKYRLSQIVSTVPEGLIIPVSAINAARRELVEALDSAERVKGSNRIARRVMSGVREESRAISNQKEAPELVVLCRALGQIEPVLNEGARDIYLDFEDLRQYGEAVRMIRDYSDSVRVFLASPRIQKPGETGYFKMLERQEPDGVLIRSLGAAEYFKQSALIKIGDFSLNVANPYTAECLKKQADLEYVTVSYDLNVDQVMDLLRNTPPEWLELTLHQHMPMFHMEHCVFCSFLSKGRNYEECGRPCEQGRVMLKDRVGQAHILMADAGCRNTLYNGRAQTGALHLNHFLTRGLRRYRIELLNELPKVCGEIVAGYRRLLKEGGCAEDLIHSLGAISQLGVTMLPKR